MRKFLVLFVNVVLFFIFQSRADESIKLSSSIPSEESSKKSMLSNEVDPPFLEAFPHLSQFVYKEPVSGFYFGMGLSPVGFLKDRFLFSVKFLQAHYFNENWNFEILSSSIGVTQAKTNIFSSTNFVFRSSPKYKINNTFSIGPLIGVEFITFPQLGVKLLKDTLITSYDEPFSSSGMIYGVEASQTFPYKENYLFQVTEVFYQQTYSNKKTDQSWLYRFNDSEVQANPDLIAPSTVFQIELSFLF